MSHAASAAPDRRGAPAEGGGASCWSDVTQNPRTARPRRGRKITRLPHHGLMTQKRERDCLLRFAVEKQLIEQHNGARLNLRRQSLDERRILCAPARDDDFRSVALSPPRDRPTNRLGREGSRRRHRVVVGATSLLHTREQFVRELDPEPFSTRALGRRLVEIGIRQQLTQYFR